MKMAVFMVFTAFVGLALGVSDDNDIDGEVTTCTTKPHVATALLQKEALMEDALSLSAAEAAPMMLKVTKLEKEVAKLLTDTAELETAVGLPVGRASAGAAAKPPATVAPAVATAESAEATDQPEQAASMVARNSASAMSDDDDLNSIDDNVMIEGQEAVAMNPLRNPERPIPRQQRRAVIASAPANPEATAEEDEEVARYADRQSEIVYGPPPMLLEEKATGHSKHSSNRGHNERVNERSEKMMSFDPTSLKKRVNVIERKVGDLLSRVTSLENEIQGHSVVSSSQGEALPVALKSRITAAQDHVDSLQTRVHQLQGDVIR